VKKFKISVESELPGNVLQGALVSLILYRVRLRRILRETFPDESSAVVMQRLARIADAEFMLSLCEDLAESEIERYFGKSAEHVIKELKTFVEYEDNCATKVFDLIQLSSSVTHLFRVARAREPVDWEAALDLIEDELSPPFFAPEREAVEDYIFRLELDAESLMRHAYLTGMRFGEIEGRQRQIADVARAGGAARAKRLEAMVDHARERIRRVLQKDALSRAAAESSQDRPNKRRLSASAIATTLLHGEESDLGYRKLAEIASEEIAKFNSVDSSRSDGDANTPKTHPQMGYRLLT
jgi:hypothetical protein